MSNAFVLSGGGAAGDFEIGAVRLLLQRGVVPDILVGTSVGAINAAKIAEGEGKPTQGFAGLMAIWLSLRWNDDMWKPAAWVANVDVKFQRALSTMVAPVLSGPARSNNFIDEFVNGVSWLLDDGQKILALLDQVMKARSLLTLEPITARINTSLDTAALAASGRKLRLGTISLETGRLRFVTETGAIMERDQVTPVGTMAGQAPAAAAQLQSEIATLDAEIRSLQTDLKNAAPGGKSALAAQIATKRQARDVKRAQLASALASVPRVPLQVPLPLGILASASIGVVFPPVRLGDEFYVDGGHRDSLSADAASRLGATNIFCVLASPAELDPPTPDHPEPQVDSYATKTLLEIGLRAGLGIHLNEIVAADILRPSGFAGAFTLVAPRVSLHDLLTLDPGLIRQSIGYGFMRAADVVDQLDPASAVSKSAEAITMLRTQMWRKECELMGRPIPTAPDVDTSTPNPARYAEILADAATLRGFVANRAQQGGALPPEAARWGRTWEDHPWYANCAGPAVAISPGPDQLEIFGRAVDGRTMTGSWSPSAGWQGWRGVAHGFGAPSGWIEPIATGGEVHAFAVAPDGGIIQSVRTLGARVWSQWLPVGQTAQGNAASIEGSPVHAISTTPGRIDLFYANKLGSVVTTRWSATTGWSLPRFISGAKTNPGGHVSVVSRNPQQIDIFMVAEARAIMTAGLTDGAAWTGWSPTSPGAVGMVGSYVSAVSRSTNLIDIFFADMNGRTTTSAFDPVRDWIHIGSIQGGMTSPGGFVTGITANTNTLDVFCVGTDHRVYTASWSPAGGWMGWVPTSATNAMPGLPVWPASRRTNQLDIVYTTVGNQILTAACAVSGAPWGGPWSINDHWQLDDLM